MKINYLVLGLLLGTIDIEAHKIVQRSKDSDEDKALSAINAAIDQELGDDTPIKEDKALAAVENADAAGTLPDASNMEGGVADDAEKKKVVVDGPPPAVSEMDANGNKKTEVELLMEAKIRIKILKIMSDNNKLYCEDSLILILFFIYLIIN